LYPVEKCIEAYGEKVLCWIASSEDYELKDGLVGEKKN